MTITRETLAGRMTATDNPDTREATRNGLLWGAGAVLLAASAHLAYLVGQYIGTTLERL